MKVYSLYDSKAEGFMPPFFQRTRGMAVRVMMNSLLESAELARYAADYTLFELGDFDEKTGAFKEERENLGQLTQYQEVK